MRQHTYYQPNEWDQMLIAAGFAKPESFDEDYQDYLRKCKNDPDLEAMSYSQWLGSKQEWDRLNAEYETEFPDVYADLTPAQERRQRELLRSMGDIEWALGY